MVSPTAMTPPVYEDIMWDTMERLPSYHSASSTPSPPPSSDHTASLLSWPPTTPNREHCDTTLRASLKDLKAMRQMMTLLALEGIPSADNLGEMADHAALIKRSAARAVERHHDYAAGLIHQVTQRRYETLRRVYSHPVLYVLRKRYLDMVAHNRLQLCVLRRRRDHRLEKLEEAMAKVWNHRDHILMVYSGYMFC